METKSDGMTKLSDNAVYGVSFADRGIAVRTIEIMLNIFILILIYITNSSSGGGFAAVAASDKFQSHVIVRCLQKFSRVLRH